MAVTLAAPQLILPTIEPNRLTTLEPKLVTVQPNLVTVQPNLVTARQNLVTVQPRLDARFDPQQVYVVGEIPSTNIGLGNYEFGYELSDGQRRQERAEFIPGGLEEEGILRVSGSYSYFNPFDGQTYTVDYVADENGFHPSGAHLPKTQS